VDACHLDDDRRWEDMLRYLAWTIGALAAVLALASCSSNTSTSPTLAGSQSLPSSPTDPAVVDPLDGTTWRNTFTCDDISKALEHAGLQQYEKQVLRPDNLGHCDETMHTTLMFSDGVVSSMGGSSPYELVNDHTYVSGFLTNTYHVEGNRLIITDTKIIAALYPYDPKIMPGEHAFDVGALMAAPFLRVS
jgi:hypothetical protein